MEKMPYVGGFGLIAAAVAILYAVINGIGLLRRGGGVAGKLLALNLLEAGLSPLYMWYFMHWEDYLSFHWLDLFTPGVASFSAHLQTMLLLYLPLIGLLLVVPALCLAAHNPLQRFAARRSLQIGVLRLAVVISIFEIIGSSRWGAISKLAWFGVPVLLLAGTGLLFWSVHKIHSTFETLIMLQWRGVSAPSAVRFQPVTMGEEGLAVMPADHSKARPLQ